MSRPRYLIVQTCHIPHFFFAVSQLRRRFPEARIEALVLNHEQVRYYVGLFGILDNVYYLPDVPQDEYDGVIFPLLNRGYRTIKRQGWSIKGRKLDLDFEGNLEDLSGWGLRKSYFLPLHAFTAEFQEYLATFPHRPIGESVLFCHSCDRTLVRKLQPQVSKYLTPKSDICMVRSPSLRRAMRRIRGRSFDAAVVFFSGEKGFAHLKLLPFLLRIPKILVVNENGDCFYASARSLAGFLFLRVRSGFRQPRPLPPRILVFQTADAPTVEQAIRRIKAQKRFRRAEVIAVSDRESRDRIRAMAEVKRVFLLPQRPGLLGRIRFWRRLRRLAPDLTFATLTRTPGYRFHKLLFWLLPSHRLFFAANLDCYRVALRSLLLPFPVPLSEASDLLDTGEGTILFIDGTRSPAAPKAIEMLGDSKIVRPRPVIILCQAGRKHLFEGSPRLLRIVSFTPWNPLSKLVALFKCLALNVDVIAGIFAGPRLSRLHQFFLFMLPARHRLVFNRYGSCFYADREHFSLLLRNLLEATPPMETVRPILFIDKAGSHRAPQAVRRLGDQKIMREHRPVTVLCARGREALYRGIPGVERIRSYGRGSFPLALLGVRRMVGLRPEIVATVLDGRRSSRLEQLLALILPARHRLIFNQSLDCFYLGFSSLRPFWRTLRERDEIYSRAHSYSLFIQTAEDEKAVKALRMLNDPSVARPRPIVVFCRRDKVAIFSQEEGVQLVYTYEPRSYYSNLRTVARFLSMDIEVIAGVFTGRPIYRLQKMLFFGLPARHRLAFNSHLDCFYLTRHNWSALFSPDKRAARQAISPAVRTFLKLLFFFPRFLFLVIWVTGLKLKRAYSQVPEVK